MKKIAFFTPLYPQKTGIASFSEEMLPYLREKLDIDIYVDGFKPISKDIKQHHKIYDIKDFGRNIEKYDLYVYQIGNNSFHVNIYNVALQHPGIVVLHDYAIHHLIAHIYLGLKQDMEQYLDELEINHGGKSRELAQKRAATGKLGLWETDAVDYPMNKRLLAGSLGAVVFSEFARENLKSYKLNKPIHRLYLHSGADDIQVNENIIMEAKKNVGFSPNRLNICVFGFVAKSKRPYSIIKAFKKIVDKGIDAQLIYVGKLEEHCNDLTHMINAMGLKSRVKITGFVDIETFRQYVLACDMNISLRYPTMGETSGVLMRSLAAGKPSIVSNIGTFMELSNDIVAKVSTGEREETELFDAIYKIATNKEYRDALGKNAKEYADKNLKISSTAHSFIEFVIEMANVKRMRESKIYQRVLHRLLLNMKALDFKIDDISSERLSGYVEDVF